MSRLKHLTIDIGQEVSAFIACVLSEHMLSIALDWRSQPVPTKFFTRGYAFVGPFNELRPGDLYFVGQLLVSSTITCSIHVETVVLDGGLVGTSFLSLALDPEPDVAKTPGVPPIQPNRLCHFKLLSSISVDSLERGTGGFYRHNTATYSIYAVLKFRVLLVKCYN